jgi:hypothetical protein
LPFSTFQPILDRYNTSGKIVPQVVFPKAKDRKTLGLKLCSLFLIAHTVPFDLGAPKKSECLEGTWPHFRQPCQKQPSANTASFASGNKKSGRPDSPFGCNCHPLIPARTSASRKRRSVVMFPLPRTAAIARERTGETFSKRPPGSFQCRAFSIALDSLVLKRAHRSSEPEKLVLREIVAYPIRQALPGELQPGEGLGKMLNLEIDPVLEVGILDTGCQGLCQCKQDFEVKSEFTGRTGLVGSQKMPVVGKRFPKLDKCPNRAAP